MNHNHKPLFKNILISLSLLLITGCALQTSPPRPSLISQDQFSQRSLSDNTLKEFFYQTGALKSGENLPQIWAFKDLYWAAIYYNPELAEVKAQFDAVKATQVTAGQSPNPNLSLIPTYDNSTTPSASLFGVGLTVPIETNGKRHLRITVAEQQTLSAQAQISGKAWDIRNKILNNLIDLLIAQETIVRTQDLVNTQSAINNIYEKRISQGQIPTALSSQNQILYQQSLLQNQQAKTDLTQAQVKLAGIIGIPVASLQASKISNQYPAFKPYHDNDRKNALLQNPAIISALYDYQAAHQSLELELAKQVPDVSLGPGYEWNSQQGGKVSLGLSFDLPIMNNNEGPIAEAKAKREIAARHFDTIQIGIINSIEQAKALYLSTNQENSVADKIVTMQKEKQQRLNSMIKQQNVGNLPFLYAQNETQIAKISYLATKAKQLKAETTLEDAVRRPLFGPVINQKYLMRNK